MVYCDRCDRAFHTHYDFEKHRTDSSRHFYCAPCDRDFMSVVGLEQHWVQSPGHAYCQQCDEHFDSFSDLEDHREDAHWYCAACEKIFVNERGLREHNRQSHHYCGDCDRVFATASNLHSHLNSSIHKPKNVRCPFRSYGCELSFVSTSALALHLEAGTCKSGMTRNGVNRQIMDLDRSRLITDPSRMIQYGDVEYSATERAWNGYAYECYLCHEEKRTLAALNQHLRSPRHDQKIYKRGHREPRDQHADTHRRCPKSDCDLRVTTLSALLQHVESGKCGVVRFKQVQDALERVMNGLNRLTF